MADIANAVAGNVKAPATTSKTKQVVKYKALDGTDITLTPNSIVKNILTPGESLQESEYVKFMAICKARRLNPFAGDCHLTPYKGKASVIVSKDYFLRTANRHDTYQGYEAGVIVKNGAGDIEYREGSFVLPDDVIIGGWAKVHDSRHEVPTYVTVSMQEYNLGQSTWKSKPATMIRKVALVQALRETYPDSYGGLYDADEMPPADSEPREVEIIEE